MGVDSSMCSRTDWQMGNSGKCQMDQFIFSPVGLSKWYYVFSKIIIICLVKRVLKKNMGRCVRNAGPVSGPSLPLRVIVLSIVLIVASISLLPRLCEDVLLRISYEHELAI